MSDKSNKPSFKGTYAAEQLFSDPAAVEVLNKIINLARLSAVVKDCMLRIDGGLMAYQADATGIQYNVTDVKELMDIQIKLHELMSRFERQEHNQ